MIAKITLGGGFRGALDYLMNQKEVGQEQTPEGLVQGERANGQGQELGGEPGREQELAALEVERGQPSEGKLGRIERGIGDGDGLPFADGERHRIIGGNMSGQTPRELAREFGAVRQIRPDIARPVHHASMTAAKGERLTTEQWQQIAEKYAERMGFANSPYVVVQHRDTAFDHVHIVASRIGLDGRVVNEWQNKPRSEQLMREVEQEYGLQPVRASHEGAMRAPTRGEIEHYNRTGELSAKMRLQGHVEHALREEPTATQFIGRLQSVGVEVIPNLQSTGRVSGISFRVDGEQMKGSDLGRGFSWNGLQGRGLSYEAERDMPALLEAKERAQMGREQAAEMVVAAPERTIEAGAERSFGESWQNVAGMAGQRSAAELDAVVAAQPGQEFDVYDQLGSAVGRELGAAREMTAGRGSLEELQRAVGLGTQEAAADPLDALRRAAGIEAGHDGEPDPVKRLEQAVGVDRERGQEVRLAEEHARELEVGSAEREAITTPAGKAAEKVVEQEVERESIEYVIDIGFGF